MAINPSTAYSGQVDTGDAAFPLGRAQNEVVEGDGSGTPLEALWISDIWGFQQNLLDEAGITASGVPDEVGASDYTDAIKAIIGSETASLAARVSVLEGSPKVVSLIRSRAAAATWTEGQHALTTDQIIVTHRSDISNELQHGATLTRVDVLVTPGNAVATETDRMRIYVVRCDATGSEVQIGSYAYDDGTATAQTVSVTGLTETVDRANYRYSVIIRSSVSADVNDDTATSAKVYSESAA